MYSNSDFERFFIRYKAEAVPAGESMQKFCFRNKLPYNLFEKWYKDVGARYQSNIHTIERIDVQIPAKGDYRVDLIVNWQAMGIDGKYTAFKARQQWKIVDGGGYWPRIVSYVVEPAH